jgi:hypothetical protein
MMLRRMFRQRRGEITRGWRKLHNEELGSLYSSTNIVKVVKLRKMRWVGHVACTVQMIIQKLQSENLYRKDNLGDLGVDGRIILKCTLKK